MMELMAMHAVSIALAVFVPTLAALYMFAFRCRLLVPGKAPAAHSASLAVGTATRRFTYVTPDAPPPNVPLLIVFHGGSGSAGQIRQYTGFGFDRLAEAHGFVVAYPEGIGGNWNTCQKGRRNAATRRDVDDVGFTRALIAWFATHYRIDPSMVFAAGYSNGGHMCFRLALEMAGEIAGFAAISANRPAAADSKCSAHHACAPMMILNGTADPINPYRGGDLSVYGLRSLGPVMSSMETAASFAPPQSMYRRLRLAAVEKHTWGTETRDDVVLLEILGGGHTIPQPRCRMPRIFGKTNADMDAPLEIWQFFCRINAPCTIS